SNLHQIGIALHLYLEDEGKRPADLVALATSKYLDAGVLKCPADRSPALTANADGSLILPTKSNASPFTVHVSYQTPLSWPDDAWDRLMQLSTRAGIVACTFHDIRSPANNSS